MSADPSRRQMLQCALAAGGFAMAASSGMARAQQLAPTLACEDTDEPTQAEEEGPFYKPRSPQRDDLAERGTSARLVEFAGFVLARDCTPVPRVLVDLWHADEKGYYDDGGFRYRGHVFTDTQGRYRFHTILPALYPGRTRHFHVKVFSTGSQLLTTQLYFPNEPRNARDSLFRRALLMRVTDTGEAMAARFDFVLDLRRPGA